MADTLILAGSPRRHGTSAKLAKLLSASYHKRDPEGSATLWSLGAQPVKPCKGCDWCKPAYQCVIADAMQELYPLIDAADHLVIVSPVYFAGAPAQMKAFLDRLQPYFWKQRAEGTIGKRPASLFIIGEGGDPHGFEPLIGSMRSALAVAGFSLDTIYDCVGLTKDDMPRVVRNPHAYRYQDSTHG